MGFDALQLISVHLLFDDSPVLDAKVVLIRADAVRARRTAARGSEWRYEVKLDGFRAIGRKAGRAARNSGPAIRKTSPAAFRACSRASQDYRATP